MRQIIRRLLAVIIWVPAVLLSVGMFWIAPDANGYDGAKFGVALIGVGILVIAYITNKLTNWIFAD